MPYFKAASLVILSALVLAGCSTPTVRHQPKADYREFTDVTWRPETTVRPPFRSTEIAVDTVAALEKGVYAFYDTHRSFFTLESDGPGQWVAREATENLGERAFTWSKGAVQLVRDGKVLANEGPMRAERLDDGRILLKNDGKALFNLALQLRAFDISGKPVRQFLRNSNNQPDTLAWFVPGEAKFPKGSVAYLATYWLGDDEIVIPSQSAFTGTATLEKLLTRFTPKSAPYCISYLGHTESVPYGLSFEKPAKATKVRSTRRTTERAHGRFVLSPVERGNMFCSRLPEAAGQMGGEWKITRIQGTRVLELKEDAGVDCADMGIQPINNDGVDIGFAEVMRADNKGKVRRQVVPVRIVRNNEAVTDFRLKFNEEAAAAVEAVLAKAEAARAAHEAQNGARAGSAK